MPTTKQRILATALHLFAKDGYEAVSVSQIAGELGITKGALYRHYQSKRDIFDSILKRMFEIDAQRAKALQVPEKTYAENPQAYQNTSFESIRAFTVAQFLFWTKDAFAVDFRKMLTLEQYRSAEMAELYGSCIVAGPVGYMQDLFTEMMAQGLLKKADPKQLAVEYYAPLYLLIHMADGALNQKTAFKLLRAHIDRFIESNAETTNQTTSLKGGAIK